MTPSTILLASHGTVGAVAAETAAIALAASSAAALHHLLVVPDFWKGMMGDDWLNNAITQIRFGNYVENQLAHEAADELDRLDEAAAGAGLECSHEVVVGKPADCLLKTAAAGDYARVVIGAPRPKKLPGYRSRMALEPLVRGLGVPLHIVPHPGA